MRVSDLSKMLDGVPDDYEVCLSESGYVFPAYDFVVLADRKAVVIHG